VEIMRKIEGIDGEGEKEEEKIEGEGREREKTNYLLPFELIFTPDRKTTSAKLCC
jgi:hypothetical protein